MNAEVIGHQSSPNNNILFLAGPTGVGKSEIAVELALQIGGEIVCGDAFQIYAGMAMLTAQPGEELTSRIAHHLYGCIPPTEQLSAAKLAALASPVFDGIRQRGRVPIVVGGSGLYLQAIGGGLDPLPEPDAAIRDHVRGLTAEAASAKLQELDPGLVIDFQNPRRVTRALEIVLQTGEPLSARRAGQPPRQQDGFFLCRTRDDLQARIQRNVEALFAGGAIDEARSLDAVSATACMAIGYRQAREVALGKMSVVQAIEEVAQATRRYAKRQMTWFRNRTSLTRVEISPGESAASVVTRGCLQVSRPEGPWQHLRRAD